MPSRSGRYFLQSQIRTVKAQELGLLDAEAMPFQTGKNTTGEISY